MTALKGTFSVGGMKSFIFSNPSSRLPQHQNTCALKAMYG